MIAFLRGQVVLVTEKYLILDVNQVGYQVGISARDAVRMPPAGGEVTVYTYMSVREDDVSLYGFLDEDDLVMFRQLIGISGIGPKAGLGLLSAMNADEIRMAVLADDPKMIAKAPGIGPKSAKKLILELKDKVDAEDMLRRMSEGTAEIAADPVFETNKEEAVQILVALGYSRSEALKAVRSAPLTEDMDADQILTAALQDQSR